MEDGTMNELGFQFEARPDGVFVYHFYDARRESLDRWFELTTRHDQEAHAEGRHVKSLIWLHGTLIATPYALYTVRKAAALTPKDLRESVAVIVENGLVYKLLSTFLSRLPADHARSVTRIFRDEASAIQWLTDQGNNE
jgi:hypothetical protein